MIPPLQALRAYLDALAPGLFNASLAALLFVALWGIRKWKPLFFAKLPQTLQAWPALATGAVIAALSASTDGNIGQAVLNALGMAFTGLLSGVMSVGVHRVLTESPLPYNPPKPDATITPKKPPGPLASIVFALALMSTIGCSSFLHFSDKGTQAVTCAVTSVVLGPLEALAALFGFPLSVITDLYQSACNTAAASGANQKDAEKAGLSGAKVLAAKLQKSGAHFEAKQ